jgi:hypothetical protein
MKNFHKTSKTSAKIGPEMTNVLVADFYLLAIYSQKGILKIKSAKIKCFLSFLLARIPPNFKKNHQISIHELSTKPKI